MTNGARSVFVYGVYLMLSGVSVAAAPNLLLPLFFLPTTNEVWIRLVGVLIFWLGFYYVQAARKELTDFFRWTVYGRSSIIVILTAFVLLGFAGPGLILLGVTDLLSAIWTALALRSSPAARAASPA